jgi:hypothetical protein
MNRAEFTLVGIKLFEKSLIIISRRTEAASFRVETNVRFGRRIGEVSRREILPPDKR